MQVLLIWMVEKMGGWFVWSGFTTKNLRHFTKNKPSFCQNKKIVAITSHFLKFQAQAAIKTLISSPTCPLSRFLGEKWVSANHPYLCKGLI
jgi:hypothetical protein